LDVQELDSRLDLLRHRLANLPEAQELAATLEERGDLQDRARDARILVDDLTREQRKAEADVEQVRTRRKRDQDRMDQGLVTSPKDLSRMQQEMVSLERRISDLEDTQLEVMERVEAAANQLTELEASLAEKDQRVEQLTARRDDRVGDIDAELAGLEQQRKQAADGLPDGLMTLYGRLREQKGGVGAAALRARRCTGCNMNLTAADLGAIAKAPTDEVLRCEECDRILVRTSESGI
jgi:predicted  nucleic acid-binding Zn-ribbon protein